MYFSIQYGCTYLYAAVCFSVQNDRVIIWSLFLALIPGHIRKNMT